MQGNKYSEGGQQVEQKSCRRLLSISVIPEHKEPVEENDSHFVDGDEDPRYLEKRDARILAMIRSKSRRRRAKMRKM